MSVYEKMTAIADAIRAKTGGTDALTLDGMAEAIPQVYAAGITEMWESIQAGGKTQTYQQKFESWKFERKTFKPIYDVRPTQPVRMFYDIHKADSNEIFDLEEIEREQGIVFDFSQTTNLQHVFNGAEIDVVNVVDARNASATNALYWTFSGVQGDGKEFGHPTVKRINKFIVGEKTDRFYMTFYCAYDLEHCVLEGEISKNGFSFGQSSKIDKESILSVLNCLKDYSTDTSGTKWVVALGTTNLAKLTEAEKAIATEKGWSLA